MGLLREKGVEFAWFDILSDEDVRSGLKRVNDWPSESSSVCGTEEICADQPKAFPQIILNGELLGGLDIFKEMLESGEFEEVWDGNPE